MLHKLILEFICPLSATTEIKRLILVSDFKNKSSKMVDGRREYHEIRFDNYFDKKNILLDFSRWNY